jgi:hypothetical protein
MMTAKGFGNIYQQFLSKEILVSGGYHILKSIEKPDLSVFSDSEEEILEFIAQLTHDDGRQRLLKVSQAFKKTEPLQLLAMNFQRS